MTGVGPLGQNLTVVIATLGGSTLKGTIATLNEGTVIPRKIFVCIPEKEALNIEPIPFANVEIIATKCRGQVSQRLIGFKNSVDDFVMQLDDDIFVDKYCIEHLMVAINRLEHKSAVAPAFIDIATGDSVYKRSIRNGWLGRFYYWLMNGSDGYQPGKVDKSGLVVGLNTKGIDLSFVEVEWLPGGCILHRRENLVLENFYPFKGKAYGEDVIHSHLLRVKGVLLWVVPDAICQLEPTGFEESTAKFLKALVADFKVRRYYMSMKEGLNIRTYIYYIAMLLVYFGKKFKLSLQKISQRINR